MTRYLSSLLGATEPKFAQGIQQLEHAGGSPSADIRLTTEVQQKLRHKISQLGLDPNDTNGPELYSALHDRLRQDDEKVRRALRIEPEASSAQIIATAQKFLQKVEKNQTAFVLKASVAKRLLKKKVPKNTMKQLGYRSLDSMLKHEPVAAIYAAMHMHESVTWRKAYYEQYAKLRPIDFEQRAIAVVHPKSQRWVTAAEKHVEATKQNIMAFRELGAVVLLPLQARLEGLSLVVLLMSLNALNDIRAQSSFAKLQQVKPDFGKIILATVNAEPLTSAQLAGQPVPWRMIQRFYGRFADRYHAEVFEPHVQPEDLHWHNAEDTLVELEPALSFWKDTQYLGLLHEDGPVSCNALDVALSYCNRLPFQDRIVHFFRDNLWHELMMRYLHQENLEEAVHKQLSRDLIDEEALA